VDALGKQGILSLKTLMGYSRFVARILNPLFEYELRMVSAIRWN
jgi:hypothetical protein